MNIDEFLTKPTKTLIMAIFNVDVLENKNFRLYSKFRKTKFSNETLDDSIYEREKMNMKSYFELDFQRNGSMIHYDIFNNYQGNSINFDKFIDLVYFEIIQRISKNNEDYEKDLILGIFSMRGSSDFTAGYMAIDANASENQLDKYFKLILNSEKLLDYLNLNFREVQAQFVSGENQRDTQIRVNLGWFYTFNQFFKSINEYKANTLDFQANNGKIRPAKMIDTRSAAFVDRINFYRKNILGKELSESEVENIRNDLFGDSVDAQTTRDQRIRAFIQETTDDVCVGCKDEYDIKDRSFKMPYNNNRWYLEINHIIPFSNSPERLDVPENLIKLCAVCHRALTPNRAEETLQKTIIKRMIYNSRTEIESFITYIANENNMQPVDFVFNKLR